MLCCCPRLPEELPVFSWKSFSSMTVGICWTGLFWSFAAGEEDVHGRICTCLSFRSSRCELGSFLIRYLRKYAVFGFHSFSKAQRALLHCPSLQINKMSGIGFRGHSVKLVPASCLWMSCSNVRKARQLPWWVKILGRMLCMLQCLTVNNSQYVSSCQEMETFWTQLRWSVMYLLPKQGWHYAGKPQGTLNMQTL